MKSTGRSKKLLVFLVDSDKEKNRVADENHNKEDSLVMIILDIPWGWELMFSNELSDCDGFQQSLGNLPENNPHEESPEGLKYLPAKSDWALLPHPTYENLVWIRNVKKISEERISRFYSNLDLDVEEKDLRENICPESPEPPPEKTARKVIPPAKKGRQVIRDVPDYKKRAAGDKD